MTQKVEDNKVVSFLYTLTSADGEEIDASGDEPMPYLHGADNIVPGLENSMAGKGVGDAFKVVVPPEEGYGLPNPIGEQTVPRDAFPPNVDIEIGTPFMLEAPDGSLITIWITAVGDDSITFDTNHPLAGEELHFDIEIVDIRDATAEELDHGHPHGPHGHHH